MSITFDTTGFQQQEPAVWADPRTGDGIRVNMINGPLDEPAWLEDVASLRRNLARGYAETGCLIEADPLNVGGVWGMYQLIKMPIPGERRGECFMVQVMLAKAPAAICVLYLAREIGVTGIREAGIAAMIGFDDYYLPHPYDPQLKCVLPFHRADDPAYDAHFPDHPLSRARAFARRLQQTGRIDPAFIALPDFRGHGGRPQHG